MKTLMYIKDHWINIAGTAYMILNIINGMVVYPSANKSIKFLLDFLTWTTHRDSVNSVKIPIFQRSQDPSKLVATNDTSPTAALVLIPFFIILGALSCVGAGSLKNVGSCVTKEMSSQVDAIFGQVWDALKSANWSSALAPIETKATTAVVKCAAQEAVRKATTPGLPSAMSNESASVSSHGREYLKK